ncbi:MAG: choice-of-anchor J domain-containing protein [Muribaculaceae bacterium]|nr:choice-of-anchor J domain-containing protein [Muribaculaceae bacterium]
MKKFLLTVLGFFGLVSGAAAQATGTPESPLTVEQFLDEGIPAVAVANTYVTGYIVGYVPDMYLSAAVFGVPDADGQKANILIGGSSAEDEVTLCIPVQLPAGDIRNAINLAANPDNLGRRITLCGSHEKYFGANGLKGVTAYAFDGQTITGGTVVPAGPVTSLSEDFASIPSNWSNIGSKPFYSTSYQNDTYAAMTGFKGTAPFDQWLISPAIDIEKCAEKVLTFNNQVNGYGSTTTTFKAYVLTSNDPATATKTELNANWATAPASGYSGWVESGAIDLSAYKGQIYIGFNYVASEDANYATWCVTKVRLNAGSEPVPPVGGNGTAEAPLSVDQLLAKGTPAAAVANTWVKGYIVGYIPGMNLSEAVFGATGSEVSKTNILLAGSATETSVDKCIPVQLPAGAVRDALNLSDNPGNLGRLVTLCGSQEKYFGANGLKSVTTYTFDGAPVVPPVTSSYIYEGLVNNADDFVIDNGTLPEGLSYIWAWDDRYGLKASAYVQNVGYVSDAWAISPVIDLTDCTDVTVSLSQAANFFKGTFGEQAFFGVRTEGGEWQPVDLPAVPETDSWTFVDSGEASLAEYEGKKIQLGFNYKSNGTVCGTWEIKNLKVSGTDKSGVITILDAMSVRVNGRSIEAPAGAKAYSINGIESGLDNLTPGLYIVRTGNKAVKVVVK